MGKKLKAYTDGTYIFQETDEEGKFLFYRQDGGILSDIGLRPIDMYEHYMFEKMFNEGRNISVSGQIHTMVSDDETHLLLIATAIVKEQENELAQGENKTKGPIKRKLRSIFGRNKNN